MAAHIDTVHKLRTVTGIGLRDAFDLAMKHEGNYDAALAEVNDRSGPEDYVSPEQKCREALRVYYAALDRHEHAGKAMTMALAAIQDALGMCWVQGASLPIVHQTVATSRQDDGDAFLSFVRKYGTTRILKLFSDWNIRGFVRFMTLTRHEVVRWANAGDGSWNYIQLAQDIYRGGIVVNEGPELKLKAADICLWLPKDHTITHGRCLRIVDIDDHFINLVDSRGVHNRVSWGNGELSLLPSATKLLHCMEVQFNWEQGYVYHPFVSQEVQGKEADQS